MCVRHHIGGLRGLYGAPSPNRRTADGDWRQSGVQAGNRSVAFLPQALDLKVEGNLPRQLLFFGSFASDLGDLGVDLNAALKCQALGRSGFGRRWRTRLASQQRGAEPGPLRQNGCRPDRPCI